MKMTKYLLQKVALSLSIVIVLNLLFNYAIFTAYPSPKFDDFCGKETREYYDNKDKCEAIGGEWVAYNQGAPRPVKIAPAERSEALVEKEYCDASATCRKGFEEARDAHNKNVFITLVSLGIISLIAGFFFISVSAVSSGFIFGGLLSFLIGTVRYWSGMNDYTRLAVLVVVLTSLIWVGYRKLKDK